VKLDLIFMCVYVCVCLYALVVLSEAGLAAPEAHVVVLCTASVVGGGPTRARLCVCVCVCVCTSMCGVSMCGCECM
jgi:hypothetical protein